MNLKAGEGLADRLPALDRMAVEPGQTCEEGDHNDKCSGNGSPFAQWWVAHNPREDDSYKQLFGKKRTKLGMGVDAQEIGKTSQGEKGIAFTCSGWHKGNNDPGANARGCDSRGKKMRRYCQ